ncbi:hypothetical protein BGX26_007840, partial [Mortierella sp. AD094]
GSSMQCLKEAGTQLLKQWESEYQQRRDEVEAESAKRKRTTFLEGSLDGHREAILTHSVQKLPGDLHELRRLTESSTENSPVLLSKSISNETISTLDNAAEFFSQSQSLQDVVLETLQKGEVLPAWARDRPSWTFQMKVGEKDYGPDITSWYNQARVDHSLTHNDVDKIAYVCTSLSLPFWHDLLLTLVACIYCYY